MFCRVVDNFGDAGVCWRLARQLVAEHARGRHAVDRRPRDARAVRAAHRRRRRDAIARRRHAAPLADEMRRRAPAAGRRRGVRLRLAGRLHRGDGERAHRRRCGSTSNTCRPSRGSIPCTGSRRRSRGCRSTLFLVSRIHAQTGGLIRERACSPSATPRDARAHARRRGCRSTLFCYPNPALPALLDAWSEGDEPIRCRSRRRRDRGARFVAARRRSAAGQTFRRGALTLDVIPFGTQDAFDRLLWRPTSISCAARTRSFARNGRRARSSGTSIRRPRTRIG